MELGIFAKTFAKPSLDATFDSVVAHGLTCVQFNLSCIGLPTLPEQTVEPAECDRIAQSLAARGLRMAAISGTFNMTHPDASHAGAGISRLGLLAAACRRLGTPIITLCTGSRDPIDMWRYHPENGSTGAWADLVARLGEALELAKAHDVVLAIEPEGANVVADAPKARRLLDEFASPHLKMIIDPANLEADASGAILEEAFDLLGPDIVLAHAKERGADGSGGQFAAGSGVVDFERYLRLLRQYAPGAPLIIHGLDESQVAASVAHLRGLIAGIGGVPSHA